MSTATTAFVRSVTAVSTASGVRLYVCGSMSANTGVAPSYMAQFADATNEYGDVITSSPGSTPASRMQRCSPAVPDETAAQHGAPTASANMDSNLGPVGPSESHPERSTSSTSSSSRSSIQGALRLILVAVLKRSRPRELRDRIEPLRPPLALPAHRREIRVLNRDRHRPDPDLGVVARP